MDKKHKYIYWIVVLCFTATTLFLTLNMHSKSGYFNYHSEIWSDKAGYYMYLPAALNFNFNPENFPDSIDVKTGHGFFLDYDNQKVNTKYTYGIALLQTPFYIVSEIISNKSDGPEGFTKVHHKMVNIAAVFYLLMSFMLLFKYLKVQFSTKIVLLILFSIFFGTNLYYYSIDDTGMSHVYTFFLSCSYLFLLQKTNFLSKSKLWEALLFGLICGLIILIRPTNAILLCIYFFLNIENKEAISDRFKRLFQLKTFLPIVLGVIIIISPQLLYWNYLHGSFFVYSYGKEGFNWMNPKLLNTWFSPNNGLFTYSPFYLIALGSLIYMIIKKVNNGMFLTILFIVVSYVLSSWWDWSFGCSFGARSFVDYLAVLCIPLAYTYQKISELSKPKIIGIGFVIFMLISFNMKMIYSYDDCFYSEKEWDWDSYIELVTSPTK
jgi:hypothetical protein